MLLCLAGPYLLRFRKESGAGFSTIYCGIRGGVAREGFLRGLWATRKLIIALAGSAVLDWMEWVEHHSPEMVLVALIHFVLVLGVIALFVYVGQRLKGSAEETSKG